MEKSEQRKYIQNRKHWCWAAACKIVGEQYQRFHDEYKFDIREKNLSGYGYVTDYEYENGVATDDLEGINWMLQEEKDIRVDAWQRAIVMNANTAKYVGYDGDVDGNDEAKCRGIRYYLTGSIHSNSLKVETLGFHDDPVSLFDKYGNRIMDSLNRNEYVIGNAVLGAGYHSFVILCIEEKTAMLYDPSNGEILYSDVKEVFESGFHNRGGVGVIKWVQRIV